MSQGSIQHPRTLGQNTKAPPQNLTRTTSFTRTGSGLPMPPSNYENSRSMMSQSSRSNMAGMGDIEEISRAYSSTNPTQQTSLDPRLQALPTVSEADTDPLANEFAALDAMQWYNFTPFSIFYLTNSPPQDRKLGSEPT